MSVFHAHARRLLAGLLMLMAAAPGAALAQPTAADPMKPREPLPAPAGLRPFPTPPQVAERELTLEEAVAIALENQPQILARVGDYLAAQQRVTQALAPLLPQLSGLWNGFENQTVSQSTPAATAGVPVSMRRTVTVYTQSLSTTASVTASQLLWDFGKTWAARDAARAGAESSRQDIELQKDVVALAVKEAYFNQLFAARLVAVNAQAVERAELNLRSARGFFEVGTRPKFDVTRAEVDVANARVDLIRAQNAVSLARIALNTAMGIAVNAPTRVKDILAYEVFRLEREGLVGEALSRRADYRQARARAEAAEATVRQTLRDFFPNIVGSGTYGASRPDMNEIYSYGVELRWTIFDGGNKIAKYRESLAARDAAQARIRDAELSIWQQVEQAHVSLVEAEERIGAASKAVESAQENFRLGQGRFDAGVGTIIELTDAQLALTRAQSVEAQALTDYRIAIARLERALGRR